MIKYLRKDTKNGRTMYFRNGKMVSSKEIPDSIVLRLEDGVELTVDTPEPTPEPETVDDTDKTPVSSKSTGRACIFCGENAETSRFINLQTIQLCTEDNRNHTTGEIVEQMNKTALQG